jgi:hypothetical protein
MLLDEAAVSAHAIDFLHPRKKAAPPNQQRTLIIAAAAVAAVLLLSVLAVWWQLRSLDSRIAALQKQRTAQEKLAKSGAKPRDDVARLDRFALSDITWLDELRLVSERFPASGAALVEDLTANHDPKGGGKMSLSGVVDREGRIREMEDKVRDERHSISGNGAQFDVEAPGSRKWRFKETVTVAPPDEDAEAAAPAAAAPVTKAPANSSKASTPGGKR